MPQFIRHFLLAMQFFTRIPVTGRLAQWVGFSPAMLRASAAHFPGVGWVIGLCVAALSGLLIYLLPPGPLAATVAAALGTVLSVLLTGAFHEDGLADVADGLGGSLDRQRALEIMKDSRVGAFGAIAVVLALLTKVALLALLGTFGVTALCVAVFAAHVVSRTWPLLTIRCLPHVGDAAGSKSKPLADQISLASLAGACGWCMAALAAIVVTVPWPWMGLSLWLGVAVALSGGVWWRMTRWFERRLGGFTGDCLGAIQQVGEIAFYLGLAISWQWVSPSLVP